MEFFFDQYIRIFVELPGCGLVPTHEKDEAKFSPPGGNLGETESHASVAAATDSLGEKGGGERNAPFSTAGTCETPVIGKPSTAGSNGQDGTQEPGAATASLSDRLVAEVALHETVSDLRWTLVELLPSCFFTNYSIYARGKPLPEQTPFATLGLHAGDTLKLVPALYDERSIRLHLRRFREITGSEHVLLMRELPDPNDPAGPYGSFLKPLILQGETCVESQTDLHANPSLLQLPPDDEDEPATASGPATAAGRKPTARATVGASKGKQQKQPRAHSQNGAKGPAAANDSSSRISRTSALKDPSACHVPDSRNGWTGTSDDHLSHGAGEGHTLGTSAGTLEAEPSEGLGSSRRTSRRRAGGPGHFERARENSASKKAAAKKRFNFTKLLFQHDGWGSKKYGTGGEGPISPDRKALSGEKSYADPSAGEGGRNALDSHAAAVQECEVLLKSPATLEMPEKPSVSPCIPLKAGETEAVS